MKKPVIAALCCLLALGTATVAFAEEPTPTPAPELVELSPEETRRSFIQTVSHGRRTAANCLSSNSTAYRMARPLLT